VAWLAAEGQIFAARRQGPGFGGALWRLVDGLYSQRGPDARLLLRQRIFTEAALDPFDWGVLKVAARRHGQGTLGEAGELQWIEPAPWAPPAYLPAGWAPPDHIDPVDIPAVLAAMEAQVPREGPRWAQDRPLAALLVDAVGKTVGWGLNQGGQIPTRHAELMALFGATAPGAALWCSRKPCRMCAGALATMLPAGSMVYFRDPDPGRQARATVLDPHSDDARRFVAGG
jgi:tRNA(Arg) A34 adenosine deaminase TadA